MNKLSRRKVLGSGVAIAFPAALVNVLAGCGQPETNEPQESDTGDGETAPEVKKSTPNSKKQVMKIQYLEIVTPEVEALCAQYASTHGISFSEANASFGGARIGKFDDGGMIGIRGPLRESETPVVRPYMLVEDIEAAVKSASEAGAEVAIPPMEIPEQGMFAIVIHGGIECGFWQT